MKLLEKYKYEIIIFIVDAVCMILELVASRLLSPYFGSSNIVWTSVIGIILLSSSIGNYYGGKIADLKDSKQKLKIILILVVLWIFCIPFFQQGLLKVISSQIINIKIGAIIATILIFLFPSVFMGTITPIILKLKLKDIENAGKVSGRINSIATIGGILGTFLGGFVLIPNMGTISILFVLTIVLSLLIPIINLKIKEKSTLFVVIMILLSIFSSTIYFNSNNLNGDDILNGEIGKQLSLDTQYGRVIIYNGKYNNENVRILNIDSGYESATYTDPGKENELIFEYTKKYDLMFNVNSNITNTLLIGGAGYSYPKHYISTYLDKNIDVVEIDGEITNIAKKYFFLDKLIKDYNLEENHRLNLITEDGRTYLNRCTKKYDAILNDAFSGNTPAKTLTTLENIQNIKKSLNENGLYLTNIISSLDGSNSKFIKAEANTLKQVFKNVYVIPCDSVEDTEVVQNNMVIATDKDLTFDNEKTFDLNISEDEIIITDEYCPIDTLIPER